MTHPRPEWGEIVRLDGERKVVICKDDGSGDVGLCDETGTMSFVAPWFIDEYKQEGSDTRIADTLAEIISEIEVRYVNGHFELFPGPVVDEVLSRFDVSLKE